MKTTRDRDGAVAGVCVADAVGELEAAAVFPFELVLAGVSAVVSGLLQAGKLESNNTATPKISVSFRGSMQVSLGGSGLFFTL